MKLVAFHGRSRGAIGTAYDMTKKVDTDDPKEAARRMREAFEVWGFYDKNGALTQAPHLFSCEDGNVKEVGK